MFQVYLLIHSLSSSLCRYPPRYIDTRFRECIRQYNDAPLIPKLSSNIDQEARYITVRSRLLAQPTVAEYQVSSRMATISDSKVDPVLVNPIVQAQFKAPGKRLLLHYTFEQRLAHYGRDIHRIWRGIFQNETCIDNRLIVGLRNNKNTTRELVRTRTNNQQRSAPEKMNM